MRVCLLTTELAPSGGGIGTYVAAMCDVLRGAAEVTVVTSEAHRDTVSAAHPDLDIAYVPPGDEQTWTTTAVDVIADHYGGQGPDLIETQDFLGLAHGPLSARVLGHSALRDTRIVVRLHTTSEIGDVLDGVDISTPYKTALHAMERAALTAADRVLWGYGDVLGTYQRFYGTRLLAPTLRLAHPFGAAGGPAEPTHLRQVPGSEGVDEDTLKLVHIGRLERRKGVHHLLAALLRDTSDRWRLDFVGSDTDTGPRGSSMLETLQAMAPGDERVRYLGPRPREEVDVALSRSDLMVLPSLWECAAYTVLEAMSAGCPVLATPVGGITDFVEHGVTGLLTRGTGTDALAESLAPLIADPDRIRALAATEALPQRVAVLTDSASIRAGMVELARQPLAPRPVPKVTAPGRGPRRMRWEPRPRVPFAWRRRGSLR